MLLYRTLLSACVWFGLFVIFPNRVFPLSEVTNQTPWTLRFITPKWSHMSFSPALPSKALLGHPLVLSTLVRAKLPTSSESLSLAFIKIQVKLFTFYLSLVSITLTPKCYLVVVVSLWNKIRSNVRFRGREEYAFKE